MVRIRFPPGESHTNHRFLSSGEGSTLRIFRAEATSEWQRCGRSCMTHGEPWLSMRARYSCRDNALHVGFGTRNIREGFPFQGRRDPYTADFFEICPALRINNPMRRSLRVTAAAQSPRGRLDRLAFAIETTLVRPAMKPVDVSPAIFDMHRTGISTSLADLHG